MTHPAAHAPGGDSLTGLHRAALAIARELSLERALQQICDSARQVVSSTYAALGVFAPGGELETFVFSGLSPEEAARMEHRPRGRGLLRAVLEERHPIRIPRIGDDPRSYGFPKGHPVMTSFLGASIRAGDETLGNLYLTNKIGAEEFSAEDERRIEILAAHAAIAIQNARLYQEVVARERELEVRNRELAALNAVARATSSHLELDQLLQEALRQVLEVTQAEAGEAFLHDEPTGDMLHALHLGASPEAFQSISRFRRGQGFPGRVAATGQTLTTSELPSELEYLRREVVRAGFRSYACVPLKSRGAVVGAMGLAFRSPRPFPPREISLLEALGHQIGVAVENARLVQQVAQLAILEERSRIGMDLHDGVIQSIYAVGLTLEAAGLVINQEPHKAAGMLRQGIDGLNDAIRDIRNFILDLRPRRFEGDLRQGLARLAREFQANTMIEVSLDAPEHGLEGLPRPVARAIFLTAQEALANVARHAKAARVGVAVEPSDTIVELTIADDGQGFDPDTRTQTVGHGLANMRDRAAELNGRFELRSAPGKGTTIKMTLPLPGG